MYEHSGMIPQLKIMCISVVIYGIGICIKETHLSSPVLVIIGIRDIAYNTLLSQVIEGKVPPGGFLAVLTLEFRVDISISIKNTECNSYKSAEMTHVSINTMRFVSKVYIVDHYIHMAIRVRRHITKLFKLLHSCNYQLK